jgi:hypothetical protein
VQCKTSFFVQEKLYSMLQDVLKDRPGVDIVKLHKSGGVVNRNAKYRQRSRIQKTRVRAPAFHWFSVQNCDCLCPRLCCEPALHNSWTTHTMFREGWLEHKEMKEINTGIF